MFWNTKSAGFDTAAIRLHAERFSAAHFRERIQAQVQAILSSD